MTIVVKKWIPRYGAAVVNLQAMNEETCRSVNFLFTEKALLTSKRNSLVLLVEVKPTVTTELYEYKTFVKSKNKNNENNSRFCPFSGLVPCRCL